MRLRAVIQHRVNREQTPPSFTRIPAMTSVRRRMVMRHFTRASLASGPNISAPLIGSIAAHTVATLFQPPL
ncbi:MAG TPA: hypothetical protein VLC74_01910 [Rhizomicrobium sp.]|nr:hypothetical protein [Rhizomicrobium sp.]